jgi:hypothetical protein
VFLVNVPIVIVAFVVARRVVSESREPSEGRVDGAGAALAAATLAAATFSFVELGRRGLTPLPLVAAGLAVLCLVVFVLVERSVEHPMLPLAVPASRLHRGERRRRVDGTPAVVAAAVRTVPAARAGLAAAVNNTARQAGGAIGIAAFGALAGSATDTRSFVAGMHTSALIAVVLWVAASAVTLALIPGRA